MSMGWNRLREDERGQSIVFVALMAVVLMAFMALGIDLGRAYIVRVHAQNAADAAALAGAEYLPDESQASTWAYAAAAANGFGSTATTLAFPSTTQIHVTIQTTIPNYFAGVIGFPTTTIVVQSGALANATMPVNSPMPNGAYFSGLKPWGLCSGSLPTPLPTSAGDYTTTYSTDVASDPTVTMKQDSQTVNTSANVCDGSGNFSPLDLDYNKSGGCVGGDKQYTHDVEQGSATLHYVGDAICTEPGNVANTGSALQQMLTNCQQATGTACSTIGMIVPIIDGTQNGKSQVTIVGFALAVIYSSTITALLPSATAFNVQLYSVFLPPDPPAAGDCNPTSQALPCPPPLSWDSTQGLLTQ